MSFNRRPNRIAGPGFNINVRYDDQHMYKARSSANGADKDVNINNSVENFDVKEAELLVAMNKGTMYHDGMTHCFSSANGFPKGTSGLSVERDILSQVRFIGVALTEYQPSKAYSEQGFVAQVGGVVTLINEGTDIIKPGDKVELGLNLSKRRKQTREKGIPRSKIRFCIQKASNSTQKITQAIKEATGNPAVGNAAAAEAVEFATALATAKQAVTAKNTEIAAEADAAKKAKLTKALKKLEEKESKAQAKVDNCAGCSYSTNDLKGFLSAYEKLNNRVIGKAYSYARPGDRLEVGLQPRHPY